mmetsp:Transcript_55471/g.129395  ORF Transcript_55471/g.129395 Transcript_55471/m.129395 type:complete len:106 (-) Transcript_55471:178-495(-)
MGEGDGVGGVSKDTSLGADAGAEGVRTGAVREGTWEEGNSKVPCRKSFAMLSSRFEGELAVVTTFGDAAPNLSMRSGEFRSTQTFRAGDFGFSRRGLFEADDFES